MPVLIRCPFHDDSTPSLAVYEDHAYCFGGCGRIPLESLGEFARERATLPRESAPDHRWVRLLDLWHWNLMRGPMQWRQRFILKRGISASMMQRYRLGHTGSWFVIPVWCEGRVLGVRYRRDDVFASEEDPKYRNPRGQGALLFRPNPEGWPTVVTEGELDALLLSDVGCDAVTMTTGAGNLRRIALERASDPLFVATDQDEAGEEAWLALVGRFRGRVYRWYWPEGKDVSEALSRLPRSAWGTWVRERIREAMHAGCGLGERR